MKKLISDGYKDKLTSFAFELLEEIIKKYSKKKWKMYYKY
jgi:hypothetical protein